MTHPLHVRCILLGAAPSHERTPAVYVAASRDAVPRRAATWALRLLRTTLVVGSVPGAVRRRAARRTIGRDADPSYRGTAASTRHDAHLCLAAEPCDG